MITCTLLCLFQVDLDSVFKAAIWQSKSSESNNSSLEALSRHEWLECVVRIAKAKFGQTTRDNQLAPAVEALVRFKNVAGIARVFMTWFHSFVFSCHPIE